MMNEIVSDDVMKDVIRKAGLRATSARIATLRLLQSADAPVTHAEVSDQLAAAGVDQATAFRNLNDMTDVGLLRRSELGDHVYRFEIIRQGEEGDDQHPHFFCVECRTVSCLQSVKLTAHSQRESEKIGQVTEILLRRALSRVCDLRSDPIVDSPSSTDDTNGRLNSVHVARRRRDAD